MEGKLEPPANTVADLNVAEHFKLKHLKTTLTIHPLSNDKISQSVMAASTDTLGDIKRQLKHYSRKNREDDAKLTTWSKYGSQRRQVMDTMTIRELAKKEKNWTKLCVCFCSTGQGDAINCHKSWTSWRHGMWGVWEGKCKCKCHE